MPLVRRRGWLAILPVALAVAIALSRLVVSSPPVAHEVPVARPTARAAEPAEAAPLLDPALRAQIDAVVASMDRTGRPPDGVVQGGRRGSARGSFLNLERRLPVKPRGYYVETDVWPRRGRRGPERLVFGRDGEVYYSPDHYRTFVKVR